MRRWTKRGRGVGLETRDDSGSRGVAAVGGTEGWNGENIRPGSGGWCRGWADTQGAHARVCAGNCELYVDPLTVIKNCPAGYHPWRNDASRTSARERGEEQRPGCAPPRIIPSRLAATSFRTRPDNNLMSFYNYYSLTSRKYGYTFFMTFFELSTMLIVTLNMKQFKNATLF